MRRDAVPAVTGVRAVLVGMPGTGKTSVGRRLADVLEVAFVDSDDLVIAREGRSVTEIFAEQGERHFREAEADAIHEALETFSGVLALGGGAILAERTRLALTDSGVAVVLLKTGVASLLQRVGSAHDRPLLEGDPEARLTALAQERAEFYRQVATVTVDTERRSVARVAEVIARLLEDAAMTAEPAPPTRDVESEPDLAGVTSTVPSTPTGA